MGTQKGTEMAGEMKTRKETKEEADAVADQKLEKEEIQTQRENLRKDGEEIGHVMPDRHEETLRELQWEWAGVGSHTCHLLTAPPSSSA